MTIERYYAPQTLDEAAGILGAATLVEECRTLKRAILLAARGNSGVIVSQLVGERLKQRIEHRDLECVPDFAKCNDVVFACDRFRNYL